MNKLRASLAAAAALALAGCLDSSPVEPALRCELNSTPAVHLEGDTITAPNGLKYIDLDELADAQAPRAQANSSVDVCYVGFLTSGQVFDARTVTFNLGRNELIPGFEQGMVGMKVGAARRIVIPPALGYGSEPVRDRQGNVVIPANSTIVFDVGLLRIR